MTSIYKRESFREFLTRVIDLHHVRYGDDELHGEITDEEVESTRGTLARKKLVTIHHDFPYGAALQEQAAYVVRAFTGLAPFNGADHRTGWDYVCELLGHAGKTIEATEQDAENLGLELFDRLQSAYPNGFTRQNVLDRDDILAWLTDWFHHRIA